MLGNGVRKIENGRLTLENDTILDIDMKIWTAGIKSSSIASNIAVATEDTSKSTTGS